MLVDVHAHLDSPEMEDMDAVIERARNAGVKAVVTAGINRESNRNALALAEKYDIVHAALGIYPMDALKKEIEGVDYNVQNQDFDVDAEIEFIRQNKDRIIAVSECGLDYVNSDAEERKQQVEVFEKQIALAQDIKKPIIVHSRKAESDVIDILQGAGAEKVILHCFCGRKGLIKKAEEAGFYFSVPTNIVRAHNFQHLVDKVNLGRILTETDSPWLSPFRDKVNEPAFVAESVKKIAEIKGLTLEETAKNIYMNYQKLF